MHVGGRFAAADYEVDGMCVQVAVESASSDAVAARLGHAAARPDAWVPDSNVWVELARDAGVPVGEAVSIARSPVILAAPQDLATKLAVLGARPSWHLLLPGSEIRRKRPRLLVRLADPSHNASGIAVVTVTSAIAGDRGDLTKLLSALGSA